MASATVRQLPRDARRVIVRGTSGSGKTTLAKRIAEVLGVPHVELDAIRHQANWVELPDEKFRDRVASFAENPGWVVCGNYSVVAPILEARADTLVLYDLPRRIVMTRILRRTLRRVFHREELWNGNREELRNLLSRDPYDSVIVWAWTTHEQRHHELVGLAAAPPRDGVRVVLLSSLGDEALFRAGLPVTVAS